MSGTGSSHGYARANHTTGADSNANSSTFFDSAAYERDVRGIIDAINSLAGNRTTSTIEASLRDQLVDTFQAAPVTAQAQLLIDLVQSNTRDSS